MYIYLCNVLFSNSNCFKYSRYTHTYSPSLSLALIQYSNFLFVFFFSFSLCSLSRSPKRSFHFVSLIIRAFKIREEKKTNQTAHTNQQ